LIERLRQADLSSELTKGELLSILNLRPTSEPVLSTAIEDMEERFSEEEQTKIVEIIAEVLGRNESSNAVDNGDEDAMPSVENGAA
jgi:hypothetical protein